MNSPKLVEDYTRPDGVSVEVYSDGGQRFTGKGGGVVHLINQDCVMVTEANSHEGISRFDALALFRDSLLRITRDGEPWIMPAKPIDPSDPVTWRVLSHYKAELLILVESLIRGEAQFFRTLAEQLKPVPSKLEQAKEIEVRKDVASEAVARSIEAATRLASGVPTANAALYAYRNLREHVSKGSELWNFGRLTASETTTNFKKKLKRYGFEWLPWDGAGG